MSIMDWLGLGGREGVPEAADDGQTRIKVVREIVDALEELDPEQARFIASFAYILGRVAHAEEGISDEESAEMERIVRDHADLPEEQAVMVVHMARSHAELFAGTDNFLITRGFNEMASREHKTALLDCLFAVSASDGVVSSREEVEIRKVNDELGLSHDDYIAARTRYREYLSVLKQRDGKQG